MNKNILIKELIKDKKVGAITSTSTHVIKDFMEKIDFDTAEVIIEYGAGRGVITKQLLSEMKSDTVLYAFETNESFIKELIKINDKRLIVVNTDAENAKTILKNRYKIEHADYIVSTIPFTLFSRLKRRRIINKSYSLLKEKGKFITYQYSWLIYGLINRKFAAASLTVTLLNLPPAFIFEGIK